MREWLEAVPCLPADAGDAVLVGRVFVPACDGPALVAVRDGQLLDLSGVAATSSALVEFEHPARTVRGATGLPVIGALADVLANTPDDARDGAKPWLLAPCDLQAVKAAGVTFAASMLERVIEEQARGDPARAEAVRASIADVIGADLAAVRPGSAEAARIKES